MIVIATLLWAANRKGEKFSAMYDEEWVERLFRGVRRNLSLPFRFICYVDEPRSFLHPEIEQRLIASKVPGYADCVQPFEMGVPMLLMGLDTIITGPIDQLAAFALHGQSICLPRDPYAPQRACNGVVVCPADQEHVFTRWNRSTNDMVWMRQQPHKFIDDLWPGWVVSYKGHVRQHGIGGARIVYFHGEEKPHQLPAGHPLLEHWA